MIDITQVGSYFTDFDLDIQAKINKPLKENVEEYEKKLILSQMQYYTRTQDLADGLGIDKSTLTRKIKAYGIENYYNRK